jgi:hypothetical protein
VFLAKASGLFHDLDRRCRAAVSLGRRFRCLAQGSVRPRTRLPNVRSIPAALPDHFCDCLAGLVN